MCFRILVLDPLLGKRRNFLVFTLTQDILRVLICMLQDFLLHQVMYVVDDDLFLNACLAVLVCMLGLFEQKAIRPHLVIHYILREVLIRNFDLSESILLGLSPVGFLYILEV